MLEGAPLLLQEHLFTHVSKSMLKIMVSKYLSWTLTFGVESNSSHRKLPSYQPKRRAL